MLVAPPAQAFHDCAPGLTRIGDEAVSLMQESQRRFSVVTFAAFPFRNDPGVRREVMEQYNLRVREIADFYRDALRQYGEFVRQTGQQCREFTKELSNIYRRTQNRLRRDLRNFMRGIIEVPAAQSAESGQSAKAQSAHEGDQSWDCATMGNRKCGDSARSSQAPSGVEGDPGWDCATMGNKRCG